MSLRQLERCVAKVKAKKENKDFSSVWSDFRESKYITKDENGKVISDLTPRNTQRKKQSHFDNKEQYFNMFNFYSNLIESSDKDDATSTDVE